MLIFTLIKKYLIENFGFGDAEIIRQLEKNNFIKG
jgi:hypothetical protein